MSVSVIPQLGIEVQSEFGSKGQKLVFWLEYAIRKFRRKFWQELTFVCGTEKKTVQLIFTLADRLGLHPGEDYPPPSTLKSLGSSTDRNQALDNVMKTIARLEIDGNSALAERIVLEAHSIEVPGREVVKLATKVESHDRKRPQNHLQQLDWLKSRIIRLEEAYRNRSIKVNSLFQEGLVALDEVNLVLRWRYFITARNYERTRHQKPFSICQLDLDSLNQATSLLQNPGVLLQLQQHMGNFMENPDWEDFVKLRSILFRAKKEAVIAKDDLSDAFRVLINFLIRQLNTDLRVLQEVNELIGENIKDGLFLQDQMILPRDLKSIISIYIRLGEPTRARKFLQRFKNKILMDPAGNARKYNEAVIWFVEGAFHKAGKAFLEVMHASDDFYLKADGKIYAFRCLIELQVSAQSGEVSYFPGSEESFRVFFQRQKSFPRHVYNYYRNFFRLMVDFTAVWTSLPDQRSTQWEALEAKTASFEDHYLRTWLLEKISQCRT